MIGAVLCFVALLVTYALARRSFLAGILSVLTVGYFYGILRANAFETSSYFMFDAAIAGLYVARFGEVSRAFFTRDGQQLKMWVLFLVLWPLLMFFVPVQDPLVQLVGLRGHVFLVPFVLIGARLRREHWYTLGLWLAGLNVVAFAFGTAEYLWGLEHFFPYNAVTSLLYHSGDVGSAHDFRIPATFSNAHAFGGTMVLTLPIVANAWLQRRHELWQKSALFTGLLAAILGVFMSAARSHFVALALLLTVVTFSARVRVAYRVAWILVLVAVGVVVFSQERMQRFSTLDDAEFVQSRLHASVNENFLDALTDYPFGNGIGGGGTSMPFFLVDRVRTPVLIENEWGRIVLETGLVGLAGWAAFLLWLFTRPRPFADDPVLLGLRLAWFAALAFFASGFIGIGLFTSIPGTLLLFLLVGWIATHHTGEADAPVPAWQSKRPANAWIPLRRELPQR